MHTINQALAFIKPHVVNKRAVVTLIEDVLDEAGIALVARRTWSAAEMRASRVVDRHYAAHARTGTCLDPVRLPVDEAGRREFATVFDRKWEEAVASGRVVSGLVAQEQLGLSADELNTRWATYRARKIAGGIYVAHFTDENLYVLNGFLPLHPRALHRRGRLPPSAAAGV
jgi:nucleoside diphosphate kinase